MRCLRPHTGRHRSVVIAVALVAAACSSSTGSATGAASGGALSPDTTAPPATGPGASASPTTTARPASSTVDATRVTSPRTPTAAPLDGDEIAWFTSPSGNIACVVSAASGASCWITEKNWEIDQPDHPDCAFSDYGNALEIGPAGARFSCYTDFPWQLDAPSLAYGEALAVGAYRCESARTGVTCLDHSGQGFSVARAKAALLFG